MFGIEINMIIIKIMILIACTVPLQNYGYNTESLYIESSYHTKIIIHIYLL